MKLIIFALLAGIIGVFVVIPFLIAYLIGGKITWINFKKVWEMLFQ